jgi:hypothetical protein
MRATRSAVYGSLIVLGAVAACAGDQPRSIGTLHPTTYDYQNFNTYHRNRDTLVVVYGNPLAVDDAALGRAVGDAMRASGVQSNFTTAPGASAEKNLRVVVSFGRRPDNRGLCTLKPGDRVTVDRSGITEVHAAWCWSERVDSEVSSYVTAITSLDDPRFRALFSQATRELFPGSRDVNRNNGRLKIDVP